MAAAALRSSTAIISWVTNNEIDTKKFIVERSIDNTNFTAVGERTGAGTFAGRSYYSFNDDVSSLSNYTVIYYRIKEVDINNKVTYSKIVTVRISAITGVHTWPSPFTNNIVVTVNSGNAQELRLQLTDMSGKAVRTMSYTIVRGNNQLNINNLNNLASGMYTLKIWNADGEAIASQMILKN